MRIKWPWEERQPAVAIEVCGPTPVRPHRISGHDDEQQVVYVSGGELRALTLKGYIYECNERHFYHPIHSVQWTQVEAAVCRLRK